MCNGDCNQGRWCDCAPKDYSEEDPLAPATGIVNGLIRSFLIWLLIGMAAFGLWLAGA